MKTGEHTAEQIIKILEQAEKREQTVAAICREHGIAETTCYRWRNAWRSTIQPTGMPFLAGKPSPHL